MTSTRDAELDRQLETLLAKGYPALAGVTEKDFTDLVEPLRTLLPRVGEDHGDRLPFVCVVRSALVSTPAAVAAIVVGGKAGWTDMQDEIESYLPIEGVDVPEAPVYLLTGVSTGPETLGVRPLDALPMIRLQGRSPLTTDEGVAVMTQFPEVLAERNAFQALGSRAANKRIPSFWNSKGAPRLGWCWEGNPHTWLGSASATARLSL